MSVPSKSKAATVGRVPGTFMVPAHGATPTPAPPRSARPRARARQPGLLRRRDPNPAAAVAGGEPGGAGERLAGSDDVAAAAGFEDGRVGVGEPPLLDGRGAVAAQASLGEGGELVGEVGGGGEGVAGGDEPVGEPDSESLGTVDGTAGQDEVDGPGMADQAGQADGPEIAERDAEPAAEDAEDGVVGGDAEVAPEGELEATGDGVALDGGDDGFGQRQPGRAHRAGAVVGHGPSVTGREGVQVGTGAEVLAGAGEDGDRDGVVGVELYERVAEAVGGGGVDGVADGRIGRS